MTSGLSGLSGLTGTVNPLDYTTIRLLPRLTGSYTLSQVNKIDTFFRTLRADGILDLFEFLHLYGWGANLTDALLNTLGTSNNSVKVGGGSFGFTQGTGVQTSGSATINTVFDPTTGTKYTQNSATYGVWIPSLRATASTTVDMGFVNTAPNIGSSLQARFTGNLYRIRINDNSGGGVTTAVSGAKMISARRTGASAMQLLTNGTVATTSSNASVALQNRPFYVGGLNNNGSATALTTETYGADWAGAALSDSQYAAFYNAMNTLYS